MSLQGTQSLSSDPAASPLTSIARRAVLWSGGLTLVRDVLQFATMLVLVRLLSQEDYGRVALAQAVLGLLSVASFKTFVTHVFQAREPASIDWQAQFTAAVVLNSVIFAVTLIVAALLSLTDAYAGAALPLAVLSLVFLIEIPSNLRQSMLQVAHDWRRLQSLMMLGAFLGFVAALAIAAFGGGIWALVIPGLLFGLPAAIDLVCCANWRPDWSWSWQRYRSAGRFGIARMGSASLSSGRLTLEQASLARIYDFGALGVFTRSIGLATLIVGRIGPLVVSSLYSVLTRAHPRSDQFRRMTSLIFRAVAWSTIPAATFLALAAADTVALLYGAKWTEVATLLPVAAVYVALSGLGAVAYSVLLANNETRACLAIDVASAALAVVLVFWLVPLSPQLYLVGLVVHGALVLAILLTVLGLTGGIGVGAVISALGPPLAASAFALAVVFGLRATLPHVDILALRLTNETVIFGLALVVVFRLAFEQSLFELVSLTPKAWQLQRLLFLPK
jgi:O-antigen/teichoic acid export membrane protein